ncbi:hypothetical protein [Haladaptatus caseinilyticus]|uniref:hypothetical protein n=1 Tax=Haladaptatus caseinilyticus TaxID=2993314 RepID=UPI00224A5B70|nr:hypothetical protein [Haladaptatus caseinilyticus]
MGARQYRAPWKTGTEISVHPSVRTEFPHSSLTLLAADLVGEFWPWIFSVVVGGGKRLFGEGTVPSALEPTEAEISSMDGQMRRYERSGEIDLGSFALDDATS